MYQSILGITFVFSLIFAILLLMMGSYFSLVFVAVMGASVFEGLSLIKQAERRNKK